VRGATPPVATARGTEEEKLGAEFEQNELRIEREEFGLVLARQGAGFGRLSPYEIQWRITEIIFN
jgi:hypothetical protein